MNKKIIKGKNLSEIEILKDVILKLNRNQIDYMVSGSLAMNFYSVPRMTRDIDIIISIDEENIDIIFNAFKDEYYIDRDMIEDAIKAEAMFNIIHLKEVFKIDFIIKKNEKYRTLEFNNKKTKVIDNVEINIVSIEDLIISKIFWAKESLSETQLNDVKNLLKNQVDLKYIKKWCNYFAMNDLLEKVINEK